MVALGASSLAGAAPVDHEIHVRVLEQDGQPARGRKVALFDLSQWAARGDEGEKESDPHWNFVTDAHGHLVVKLHDDDGDEGIPGWGVYALYVRARPRDAGAFSPYLVHLKTTELRDEELSARSHLEWGRPLGVTTKRMELALRIQRGFTVTGRVMKYPRGRTPWPGVEVYGAYDLNAATRTGYGGNLAGPETKTDAQGRFTLRHVYPSLCHLGLSEAWIETKRSGRWRENEDLSEQVKPPRQGAKFSLEMMAARAGSFRYFGHVENEAHEPLAGITVTFGLSSQPHATRYSHRGTDTTTDGNGNYEMRTDTPWVPWITVEAKGFQTIHRSNDDDAPLRPGRYDLTLRVDPKERSVEAK